MISWRFWATTGVLASFVSGGVRGQEPVPELNGLRADHLGRVAGPSLGGGGAGIPPGEVDVDGGTGEAQVAGPAARALAPAPPGTVDQPQLAWEIADRFQTLDQCRIEVARTRHLLPADVQADRLTLRWTISETGAVSAATAVGSTPVDANVLDCVKRQMTGWTFRAPSGGALPIERVFEFRPRLETRDGGAPGGRGE